MTLPLTDKPQIGFRDGVVDAVPVEIETALEPGLSVLRAQGGLFDIGAQRLRELVDRAGAAHLRL